MEAKIFKENASKGTYFVEIDGWAPVVIALQAEMSHADLSEVTWMVFIHVCAVVVLWSELYISKGVADSASWVADRSWRK